MDELRFLAWGTTVLFAVFIAQMIWFIVREVVEQRKLTPVKAGRKRDTANPKTDGLV